MLPYCPSYFPSQLSFSISDRNISQATTLWDPSLGKRMRARDVKFYFGLRITAAKPAEFSSQNRSNSDILYYDQKNSEKYLPYKM